VDVGTHLPILDFPKHKKGENKDPTKQRVSYISSTRTSCELDEATAVVVAFDLMPVHPHVRV
jgi:hypothetical protein